MEQQVGKKPWKIFAQKFFVNLIVASIAYLLVWWLIIGFDHYVKELSLVFACSAISFALIKTYFDLYLNSKG